MSDRKKVAVIGPEHGADAGVGGSGSGGSGGGDAPFNFNEFQDAFYLEASGPYQTRKTSIVSGMSTDRLIDEHRKSIANLNEGSGGVQVQELAGVTLSRRHILSHDEYKDGMEAETFENLQSFSFGDAPTGESAKQ